MEPPILRTLRFSVALMSLTFAFSLAAAATPQENATPRSFRSFDLSYVVTVAPPSGSRKLKVWIPLPSTDGFQTISQLQLSGPEKVRILVDSKSGDRRAFVTLDSRRVRGPAKIRVAFHITRYDRQMDGDSAGGSRGTFPGNVAPFLQADASLPINGSIITDLSSAQTAGVTDPLEKAEKVYAYVVSTTYLDHAHCESSDRDTVETYEPLSGSCVDAHSLFVAMARAAGIPARLQVGFSLPEDQKEGTIAECHSWAEFYVNGKGWIPIDASEAGQEPFGTVSTNRVMLASGQSISTTSASMSGSVNYSVHPYVEVDGNMYTEYSSDLFFHEATLANTTSKKTIFARSAVPGLNQRSYLPS